VPDPPRKHTGLLSGDAARRVSADLRTASYTAATLTDAIGERALRAAAAGRDDDLRAALDDVPTPLAVATRLLLLGDDVDLDAAARVLDLESAAPLLDQGATTVRCRYDVAPHADESHEWYVVSDRTDAGGRPRRPDHVLGVGGASTTLAQLTVRRPATRGLDIGTGCGVQALHLSTHCGAVTATDVLPRAMELAATSFALSDVEVDLRDGDLTDPVAGQEFDVVVCNPPFVVGPVGRFAYRDAAWSGEDGDGLSRRAVRAAAAVLADGGTAHLLANWLHVAGEDWRDRVAGWVADLGVDALLLERDQQEPGDYVTTWLADAGEDDPETAAEWRRWFTGRRIEAVGFGWVVLRRGAGPHRVAVEPVTHPVDLPLGGAIAGWLDRIAWLRDRADDDLLAHAFRAAPDARLDTTSYAAPGGWQPAVTRLGLDSGLRWSLPCDDEAAAVVAACDGRRPLSAVAAVLSLTTGAPDGVLVPALCATVRTLVDRGVLLP
jgi:methylase of polypeptide subunit release factors